ncbi:MAG: alpha/beta fold hydrolase [Candidatus Nanopelagicales bacterium]|nr:alpha/beta fold hydrolase [Candidatus Nanopelagicales bacterium]
MALMPGAEPWFHDGNSTGILLVHGFTGSPASMVPWATAMAEHGFTVRVPRLPGHGSRWQDMNLTTWEDWYSEAERNYQILKSQCDTVFVFGLSMGGSLTLRLAENHGDDIAGIVLVNAAVHSERPDRHLLPVISKFIGSFPGISNDIKKPGQDEVAYKKIPLKAAHSLSKLWKLIKTDIPAVTQPLLLFRSEVDHVVEASNAQWILDHVSSTDKTEIVLKDSFHVATLDNDLPLIVSGSVDFVNRLSRSS